MQAPIVIAGVTVEPGSRATVDLPIPRLYTHTEMRMPVHVIHGTRPGPRLFVCAAIHGDEINGVESIRRLLQLKLLSRVRGTLIAIPVVNVYGLINRQRHLPDRRDLNRSFPGSPQGSLASRLAALFMDEIVSHCTHGIDLHSGSSHRTNLPHVRACLDNPETERLAMAFGAPVVINSRLRDGSLREAVNEKGIPILLYEAGEALRFDEASILAGVSGIVSVMRELGILPAGARKARAASPVIAQATKWVRAPLSGMLTTGLELGSNVEEGEVMGVITDPFGEQEEVVTSPVAGLVVGKLDLPLVYRGDALFNIASTEAPAEVETYAENLDFGLDEEDVYRV